MKKHFNLMVSALALAIVVTLPVGCGKAGRSNPTAVDGWTDTDYFRSYAHYRAHIADAKTRRKACDAREANMTDQELASPRADNVPCSAARDAENDERNKNDGSYSPSKGGCGEAYKHDVAAGNCTAQLKASLDALKKPVVIKNDYDMKPRPLK